MPQSSISAHRLRPCTGNIITGRLLHANCTGVGGASLSGAQRGSKTKCHKSPCEGNLKVSIHVGFLADFVPFSRIHPWKGTNVGYFPMWDNQPSNQNVDLVLNGMIGQNSATKSADDWTKLSAHTNGVKALPIVTPSSSFSRGQLATTSPFRVTRPSMNHTHQFLSLLIL